MKKSFIGEKDRRIVPRWRGFSASVEPNSNEQARHSGEPEIISSSLVENQADWHDDPSLWNALDFIAGAIVEERLDLAADAIDQVRRDERLPAAGAALITAAENRLGDADLPSSRSVEEEAASQIHRSRKKLGEYPWDAVEWMDLARSFTTLGELTKASRSVGAAVKLAPTNRFIVRAASRFYVHSNEPERALRLLGQAGAINDPWLMAPQVAISAIVGHGSIFARDGIRMLKQDFSPADLSELAAAVGTLEVENGKFVHAKKLLRQSLNGANENSVAQIEWLNRSRLGDVIDVSVANPPRLYEAGAWSSFITGDWEESRRLVELWFRDQPFSGNAATLCSFVFSEIMRDYVSAEGVLRTALRCNPKHPVLLNNMAYALINLDRLIEAEALLGQISFTDNLTNLSTVEATRGLLEFRKGGQEIGRRMFLGVIDDLSIRGERDQAGRAATNLAFEELRFKTPYVLEAVQRSLKLTEESTAAHVLYGVKQLEATVEAYVSEGKFDDTSI
jgi:tetratricopeptide (TPR) repeat protein